MTKITLDDALEQNDIFNVKKDEPHLPQDGDTPFSPASDPGSKPIPQDDPRTDYKSDIDETELYNDGMPDASGATDGDETNQRPTANRVG